MQSTFKSPIGATRALLCIALLVANMNVCLSSLAEERVAVTETDTNIHSKAAGHPRLRKYAKVAAIGALTGGVGGLILGGSLVTHAIAGAGTRTAITTLREKHKQRKKDHADSTLSVVAPRAALSPGHQ